MLLWFFFVTCISLRVSLCDTVFLLFWFVRFVPRRAAACVYHLCDVVFMFRFVPRRATALVFAKCGEQILVADKAGDVYRFSVSDNDSATGLAGTLVVGHVSMLLDVVSID